MGKGNTRGEAVSDLKQRIGYVKDNLKVSRKREAG
jgi:hypothetical protein